MFTTRCLTLLYVTCLFMNVGTLCAQESGGAEAPLHIDIPVKLESAKVVMDVGHLVMVGDMPFFIGDLNILAADLKEWNVKGQIVAVLHGDAAHLILNDDTYNTNRHVKTGNPYGKLIAGLMQQGVQIELCGATAKIDWQHRLVVLQENDTLLLNSLCDLQSVGSIDHTLLGRIVDHARHEFRVQDPAGVQAAG